MKIETVSNTRKSVVAAFSAEEIARKKDEQTKRFARSVKIPGFRPGKAPAAVVAKKFEDNIVRELRSQLFSEVYNSVKSEIAEDPSCDFYGLVSAEPFEIKEGEGVEVKMVFDVVPAFALPEYKGVELKAESTEASEEEIASAVERIRNGEAEFEKTDVPAEKGDYVKVNFEGTIDGNAFPESVAIYGKQTGAWEEAGSEHGFGASVKEISQAVIGMKAGDKKTVEAKFADDFVQEVLKGKTAVYEIEAVEVRRRKLPEMNEEFFKKFGVADEAELRERLATVIGSRKKEEAETAMRQEAVLKLCDAVDFELPQSAVDSAASDILIEYLRQKPQTEADKEPDSETLKSEAEKAAKTRVKAQIVLHKIAEAEKITVDSGEIAKEVGRRAAAAGKNPDKFVKEISKDRSRVEEIYDAARCFKAVTFIVDNAKKI